MGEELGNVNVNAVMNKCGNCRNGGHSSKECSEKVALKLFGVRIFEEKKRDELMKKSFSVENLQATVAEHGVIDRGYLSDGLVRSRRDRHGRKKGVPWTEEEHRTFLLGLKKLGKGDWRGISRKFVTTRTPTQVASHAQKYFLRQQVNSKKKRRSSLFDMPVVEDPSPRSFEIAKLMETPRLEVPQAAPMATNSGAINTHGASYKEVIPSLMLRQSEARLFPTMAAFGNAAEFANQFYRFQVKPSGENFINSSSKPFVCQQLVVPNCGSKMEGGGSSSSTVNTELELTIAPPGGVHGPANKLLGGASKMGGIIQVI